MNTPGFPQITATLNGFSQSVVNDGLYTFSFKPTGGLSPGGIDYNPKFFWNTESFGWTVRSAATASAAANKYGMVAPTRKAVVSKVMNSYLRVPRLAVSPTTGEMIVTSEDFSDSCARSSDCVGMLRSGTETRYRQLTLRGLTKADIGHNANGARNR